MIVVPLLTMPGVSPPPVFRRDDNESYPTAMPSVTQSLEAFTHLTPSGWYSDFEDSCPLLGQLLQRLIPDKQSGKGEVSSRIAQRTTVASVLSKGRNQFANLMPSALRFILETSSNTEQFSVMSRLGLVPARRVIDDLRPRIKRETQAIFKDAMLQHCRVVCEAFSYSLVPGR